MRGDLQVRDLIMRDRTEFEQEKDLNDTSTTDLLNSIDLDGGPHSCIGCRFSKNGIKRQWCKLHLKTKQQDYCKLSWNEIYKEYERQKYEV